MPSPRLAWQTAWTGQELVVWSGYGCEAEPCDGFENPERLLGSGARYDPAQDRWLTMSTEGAPSPRSFAAFAWAGDHLLVWSGPGTQSMKGGPDLPPLEDGAWYSPSLDSWSPVATEGAPAPRATARTVWTGLEVIVWGGGVPDGPCGGYRGLYDGGRIDPQTGAWRGMAPLEAPPDEDATSPLVAWTGAEMIVWDGRRPRAPRPGWRYDPALDAWTAMAPEEGPGSGACGVVWAGTELLAFGHDSFSRYDPVADRWTVSPSEVSLCAEPVWTGREVLLWRPSGSPPGANVRFDPATEVATPLEADGAPSPRSEFAVFWTGEEMLIWGGRDEATGATTNTGALYRPPAE